MKGYAQLFSVFVCSESWAVICWVDAKKLMLFSLTMLPLGT